MKEKKALRVKGTRNHFLFVYGTLLNGQRNNGRLEGGSFIGGGVTVKRYRMTAGTYRDTFYSVPYVNSQKRTHHVKGELYIVDDHLLRWVDRFEGHPRFYRRERIEVRSDDGRIVKAWIYFNNRAEGVHLVRGGDYARFVDRVWGAN